MKRRAFILGGAAAWPRATLAQPAMLPVVAYISAGLSAASPGQTLLTLRQALAEAGYVDGRSVAIEFHTAEGLYDRLPTMMSEIVRRRVAVIVASPAPAALAAKAVTTTIPILFGVTDDPVKLGLVASLARPGGNATGVNFYLAEFGLTAKRLGLLRELVPQATHIAALVNPKNAENAAAVTRDVAAAASAIGVQIEIVHASDKQEIDVAFATFVRNRQNWKVSVLLRNLAPPHLQKRWFARLLDDPQFLFAHCLTEPRGASDRWLPYNVPEASMHTKAVKKDGGWVINGRKQFISNGYDAGLYVVYANTNPKVGMLQGTSSFLVPRDTPGLSVARCNETLGCRFMNNGEIVFENMFVPLLGQA